MAIEYGDLGELLVLINFLGGESAQLQALSTSYRRYKGTHLARWPSTNLSSFFFDPVRISFNPASYQTRRLAFRNAYAYLTPEGDGIHILNWQRRCFTIRNARPLCPLSYPVVHALPTHTMDPSHAVDRIETAV